MAKKILVLEDEKDIGKLYVKFLKDRGHDAVLATDGLEGLKCLKEMTPDLILLDLGMPKMNGIEFYQYICDAEGAPKYPVLVLTGRTDLEALFKDFRVEGFIIKPFQREKLLNEVDIIFNKQYLKEASDKAKRIIIVDDNAISSQKIMEELSRAGYRSEIAMSGMEGIEKIMDNPPDMAVVSLGLADISGDLAILRLQGMTKTKHVKYVLYAQKDYTLDKVVKEKISYKSGVRLMCEYTYPAELLEAINKVFQASAQE